MSSHGLGSADGVGRSFFASVVDEVVLPALGRTEDPRTSRPGDPAQ